MDLGAFLLGLFVGLVLGGSLYALFFTTAPMDTLIHDEEWI